MNSNTIDTIVKLGIVILLLPLCGCCTGINSIKEKKIYTEGDVEEYIIISPLTVEMPLGYFALVKMEGGKGVAAIRLLEQYRHQFGDVIYSSKYGDEYRFDFKYLKYECYYRDDGGMDFITGKVYHKKDKATCRTVATIGRLILGFFDNSKIQCKNIKLGSTCDNRVGFNDTDLALDKKIIVAPTKWKNIRDVRIDAPYIKWYNYKPTFEGGLSCPEYEQYKEKYKYYYIYKVPVDKLW